MPAAPLAAHPTHASRRRLTLVLLLAGLACIGGGLTWLARLRTPPSPPPPAQVSALTSGVVASMDSPVFTFGPTWQVTPAGADPHEPADPWRTPSGVTSFAFSGRQLALLLAPGDYWGYLYMTVDGAPANRLPVLPGNRDSRGRAAGYRTLYAPERQTPSGPGEQWVVVHEAQDAGPHPVDVELWRSWGQTPLRGVAVDALPPAPARWPGVALLAAGGWLLVVAAWPRRGRARPPLRLRRLARAWMQPLFRRGLGEGVALLALLLLVLAVGLRQWGLTLAGLVLLGVAGLARPNLWAAALLFGLPFYFSQTLPILPGRATNLIDLGLLGGIVVAGLHRWLIAEPPVAPAVQPAPRTARLLGWALAGLVTWSLVPAAAAEYPAIALREWRTVFLAGGLAALLFSLALAGGDARDRWLLVTAWLAGATVVAGVGLWHFACGVGLIEAEGVQRIRAFYGSPNNLALYLERTLVVLLALLLLLPNGSGRWLSGAAVLVQGAALLLTFSKGSLVLGLPAGLVTLWLGGLLVLRTRRGSLRPLWWIAAAGAAGVLLLLPFLGTARFRTLLDLSQGTGRTRLLLWRSALQMALDHPWLGVGPDNFLYAFRSRYLLPAGWQEPNLNHPHNWVLDWWTRLGLPGLLLGTTFFGAGSRLLWARLQTSLTGPPQDAALWLGLLASAVTALVHGLIDLSYAVPDLMVVWVLVFVLAAGPVQSSGCQSEEPATRNLSGTARSRQRDPSLRSG